jgi:two-component system chemotaxis response regulator CheB
VEHQAARRGIAIVQEPDDAQFEDMPDSALRSVEVDHR